MDQYRLTSECHIIPFPNENDPLLLLYFPLQSLILKINQSGAEVIKKLKKQTITDCNGSEKKFLDHLTAIGVVNSSSDKFPVHYYPPEPKPFRTMLITSDNCNLRCIYCYGSSGDSGSLMSYEIAKTAVDLLIENAGKLKTGFIDLGFHGGGEPTLNWSVLKEVVEYAESRCKHEELNLRSAICTNGMLATEENVQWLAEHIKSITVSIDGPPEFQNLQRPRADGGPSFDHVANTIDIFRSLGKSFVFRSTATAYTSGKMPEIYTYLVDRFHPAIICIEPLFMCGRCETTQCKPPEAQSFINDIIQTMNLTKKKKVPLQYSGGRLFYIDNIFCGASGKNFFVTPSGDVTSCVEVTNRADPRADLFMYGEYDHDAGVFRFDVERYRKLCTLQVQKFESCKDCYARWHCSGDCLAKKPNMDEIGLNSNSYRCLINRAVTRQQLLGELKG